MRGGAGGPDPQAIEAGLQLGAQDERGGRLVAAWTGHDDVAPIQAAAFQPSLQEAGRRRPGWTEARREVGTELVAPSFTGAQPALQLDADRPGITHAASPDIGERDGAALIDEAANAVGRHVRQCAGVRGRRMGHSQRPGPVRLLRSSRSGTRRGGGGWCPRNRRAGLAGPWRLRARLIEAA